MRAAGTEIGDAFDAGGGGVKGAFLVVEEFQPFLNVTLNRVADREFANPVGDHAGDPGRSQFAGRRQDPFALLVEFADHPGADVGAQVIELLLDLVFHHRALFLDHQDFLQALGEMTDDFLLQGPRHADLEQPEPDFVAVLDPDP